MSETSEKSLDAVSELRLRRWARQHHVVADQRDEGWHPVVLDEMLRRDREHEQQLRGFTRMGAMVPLAPQQSDLNSTDESNQVQPSGQLLFRIDLAEPMNG